MRGIHAGGAGLAVRGGGAPRGIGGFGGRGTLAWVGLALALSACGGGEVARSGVSPVRARQPPIDLVFADLGGSALPEESPREWDFEAPTSVRPCCAFGYDLRVQVGAVQVPGVRLGNLVEPNQTGEHTYDPGAMSGEANGLIYTCRGGFIDVAHVRDYADWTVYLAGRVEALLDGGGVLELPDEAGRRFVYVVAPGAPLIERAGKRSLAITLAQWLAFRLSVWHETATWYRWSNFSAFPEEASAFSPEDIYSNVLGIEIAGAILRSGSVITRRQYNHNMTRALELVLRRLGAMPASGTQHAADSVDGLWWDSSRSLPEKHLVLRRNFDLGPLIRPSTVPRRHYTAAMRDAVQSHCGQASQPVALVLPASIDGIPIESLARLDVRIEAEVAARMPLADPQHPWVSQDEVVEIAARARAENRHEVGADADRLE